MGLLQESGVRLSYHNPYVPALKAQQWSGGYDIASKPLDEALLADVDCVAILTDHQAMDYR